MGKLIADTYWEFNLGFVNEAEKKLFLGPFYFAHSENSSHRRAVREILQSPMMYVAEIENEIAGVLRGRAERLASLFVGKIFHRKGIGRALVEHFEKESRAQGVCTIRVAATLYAVPFYLRMGYKRSTGLRKGWSFQGHGLPYQPMRKRLEG